MSSSTLSALRLLSIVQDYSLYSIGIVFLVGFFGNLINIFVLTILKLFRSNQCAFYLIIESLINTILLILIFLSRYLVLISGNDPGKTSLVWCISRGFLGQTCRLMSATLVCFVAFDQYLSTNPRLNFRQCSSMILARRLTIVSICLCLIQGIPSIIYLRIDSSLSCEVDNVYLIRYYSFFYYPILHGFLPIFTSAWFALLAYRNVRHLIRHQTSVVRRRLDRQLTAMIFTRVICFIILIIPYTIYRIYILNISIDRRGDLFHYAVHQFIEMVTISLLNLNYGINFYIFLLSSARYRRQVKYFFLKKCWKSLKEICRIPSNQIHPFGEISNAPWSELE